MVTEKFFKDNWYPKAEKNVQFYELNHYYDPSTGGTVVTDYDKIKVPYPYANARQILAEIFVKAPEPIVKPLKPTTSSQDPVTGQTIEVDTVIGAKTMQSVLKYIVGESALKSESKMVVLDGIVTGLGVLMLSGQASTKVPKYSREIYKNILWDHSVFNPYQSGWIARKLQRPLEDAKTDPKYKKSVRDKLQANSELSKTLVGNVTPKGHQFEYFIGWDIWDKKNDKHFVFQIGGNEYLVDEAISENLNLKVEADDFKVDWPFAFFVNEEMLSKSWGIGDVAPIESQVEELDKIRTLQVNHIKRFNRKYLVKKESATPQLLNQLKNPEDGTIVEVEEMTDILPLQDAPLAPDIYRMDEIIQKDMQIISAVGSNALSRGVGNQPNTLGEAQIIEQNADTRLGEKRDNVAEYFRRVFRYTAQFVQQYWKEEDVFLITGDGSKPTDWLNFKPQEIQGEYNYDVDPESLRDNNAIYRKQTAEALQTVAPILSQVNPNGVIILARQYLETFPHLKAMLDKILPENAGQTPTADDPTAALMELFKTSPAGQLVKELRNLPPEQQEEILNTIDSQVGGGAPSAPNMTGAANTVQT